MQGLEAMTRFCNVVAGSFSGPQLAVAVVVVVVVVVEQLSRGIITAVPFNCLGVL